MTLRRPLAALVLAVASSGVAAADLAECARINDDIVRLFCYDRAAGRPMPTLDESAAAAAGAQPAQTANPDPAEDAKTSASVIDPAQVELEVETEVKPDLAASNAASRVEAKAESKTETVAKSEPAKRIEARILGEFQGWSPGTRFKLDNGEVWEAVGASTHYSKLDAPTVTIQRDFIGQHLMTVEGVKSKALVRRVEE